MLFDEENLNTLQECSPVTPTKEFSQEEDNENTEFALNIESTAN